MAGDRAGLVLLRWANALCALLGAFTGRPVVCVTGGEVLVAAAKTVVLVVVGAGTTGSWATTGRDTARGAAGRAEPWAATAPTVRAAAPRTTWVLAVTTCPAMPSLVRRGKSASHETGPIVQRSLPIETLRNALTIAGSNCLPAHRVSSSRAATALIGFL
jgi:hypothetical protein